MGTTAGSTATPLAARARNAPPDDGTRLREEILAGLRAATASIAPKYFYDALGCKLFEAITELPEYYPTRTERGIFERHAAQIARAVGERPVLIDLGAGNCEKAAGLFDALRPAQYVALDVSVDFLGAAVARLRERHPELPMLAAHADFSRGLELPPGIANGCRLFFYPGSSIGNFPPDDAVALLARMRELAGAAGGALIGVDLIKPKPVLDAAYDDALGVTAAFNRNVLRRINDELGGSFDLEAFQHRAIWNGHDQRVEMHLVSTCAQDVSIPGAGLELSFEVGETIWTESSYKYEPEQVRRFGEDAGFRAATQWVDSRARFALTGFTV